MIAKLELQRPRYFNAGSLSPNANVTEIAVI